MSSFRTHALYLVCLGVFSLGCQKAGNQDKKDPKKEAKASVASATEQPQAKTKKKAVSPKAKSTALSDTSPDTAYPFQLMVPAKANSKAPERFKVKLKTTKGDIQIEVIREWSPNGVDRFYNLVKHGFYSDVAFFRVIAGFMAQTGLHGDARMNRTWRNARIQDDPVKSSNVRGSVSFAMAGPNTRTTQFFINFGDNTRLDGMGFSPFGMLDADSMKVLDALYSGYGEGQPRGRGPSQGLIQNEGNAYLKQEFPKLDYIIEATVVDE